MAGAKNPGVQVVAGKAGGGGSLTTPSAVLAGVLLAPAMLVAVFDKQPQRPVMRVVLIAGIGLTIGPLWHLNALSPTVPLALDMLCDPAVLCPAWLAGALGWAVCEFLPLLLQAAADKRAAMRMSALLEEAKALKSSWDLE
jgi:hypothetical protein